MASLNRVMLIGNLGLDPEIRVTPQGTRVAQFTIACKDHWIDQQGQKRERVEWASIAMWNKLADIAQKYLRKGSRVFIEGRLQTRTWEKDGVKKYRTEIVAEHMVMLDGRRDNPSEGVAMDNCVDWDDARRDAQGNGRSRRGEAEHFGAPPPQTEDDLPF